MAVPSATLTSRSPGASSVPMRDDLMTDRFHLVPPRSLAGVGPAGRALLVASGAGRALVPPGRPGRLPIDGGDGAGR